ncbi:unnamed protein product [Linum tenue]|uniref:C2H2-type domain-containing protein n=1 Tax=Linum tenue TaxID=586396 RepID=A0AAV0Q202_9ROSI|nr:unnamed protein product [Linum tenue]
MERHKCKLCFRVFPNGRCLGGHMKSHLAKIRLPPKSSSAITCRCHRRPDDNESFSSFSYSSSGEEEDEQEIIKSRAVAEFGGFGSGCDEAVYGLKENPRKRFRVADPEFSFAGSSSVVHDRESETESRNPTRRRRDVPGDAINWKQRFSYNRGEIEEGEEVETENGGEIKKWAEIEEDDQGIMERSSRI